MENKMSDIVRIGPRQNSVIRPRPGKTNLLIDSIVIHLIDKTLDKEFTILAVSPNLTSSEFFKKMLIDKLTSFDVSFKEKLNSVLVGKRECLFIPASDHYSHGKNIQYLYINNIHLINEKFLTPLYASVLPCVIFQTEDI